MEDEHCTEQLCNDTSNKKPKNLRITCPHATLWTTPAIQTSIEASAQLALMSQLTQSHSLQSL